MPQLTVFTHIPIFQKYFFSNKAEQKVNISGLSSAPLKVHPDLDFLLPEGGVRGGNIFLVLGNKQVNKFKP